MRRHFAALALGGLLALTACAESAAEDDDGYAQAAADAEDEQIAQNAAERD